MIAVALLSAALQFAPPVEAPAGCIMLAGRSTPYQATCSNRRGGTPTAIVGPARLCSRHFVISLRAGDRLVSSRNDSGMRHVVTDQSGRTLGFGDESFTSHIGGDASVVRRRSRWRADLQPSTYPGSSGVPYFVHEPRGRYVLAYVDGTMLDGTARDVRPLARLSARTRGTQCGRRIDLGTIGYSDDPDFSTMAAE